MTFLKHGLQNCTGIGPSLPTSVSGFTWTNPLVHTEQMNTESFFNLDTFFIRIPPRTSLLHLGICSPLCSWPHLPFCHLQQLSLGSCLLVSPKMYMSSYCFSLRCFIVGRYAVATFKRLPKFSTYKYYYTTNYHTVNLASLNALSMAIFLPASVFPSCGVYL